jgi:hypothetical protein
MSVRSRLVLFALLLVLSSLPASAQVGASASLPGNGDFFAGVGVGFGFGGVDWVEISPLVGDRPVPQFDFGVELTYRWSNSDWYAWGCATSDYGFTVFAADSIWRGLFARGEYEYLNCEYPAYAAGTDRTGNDAFERGGGSMLPVGRATVLDLTALYNFSSEAEGPYGEAWDFGSASRSPPDPRASAGSGRRPGS